jgi:ferric-dicitrate binding protein FerR (iron transport regulator)
MMDADDARLLWARHLAGEEFSAEEQRALVAALEADPALRETLMGDLDLDGALRGLAAARRTGDAFVRTLADCVAPERDATRFVRKVELALAGPPSKPPSSTKIPSIRATNRFTRRARRDEGGGAIAWRVGLAAAALFALVIVGAVGRPAKQNRPSPDKPELPIAKEAPVKPAPALSGQEEEVKRLRRLRVIEWEQARLQKEQAPAPAREDQDLHARRSEELKAERLAIEEEMRRAVKEAQAHQAPAAPSAPSTAPATTVAAEAQPPASEPAKVLEGALFAKNATTEPVRKGSVLPDEMDLLAHRENGASIVWSDGTRIDLQPASVIRLVRDYTARRVLLRKGGLDSTIARQPEERPMVFETPHAAARILGTTIRLTVNPDPSLGTGLEVRKGKVRFGRPGGMAVEVAGGQFAVAAPGVEPRAARTVVGDEEIRFVFGPAGSMYDTAKYKLDSGQLFDAARGYGWKPSAYARVPWKTPAGEVLSGHVGAARNTPSKAPEPHRAAHVAAGWGVHADTWVLPLPNGRYHVTVGVGDWSVEHGPNRVTIEDKVVVNDVVTKAPKFYAEFGAEVVVRDGELTMVCGGTESKLQPSDGSLDTILNYLVIRKLK